MNAKRLVGALLVCAAASQACTRSAPLGAEVATCGDIQMLGTVPASEEVASHRKFATPSIGYPFGTKLNGYWGFDLLVRVNQTGGVECYSVQDQLFGQPVTLNAERRAVLAGLQQLRYSPFLQGDHPIPALVRERVSEWERPASHVAVPEVPLNAVHISLSRSGCFGSCPSYSVDVYGTGRAEYHGDGYVDVIGTHAYTVPVDAVAHLVDSLRKKDIWSLRSSYRTAITDQATQVLTMTFGAETHRLEDYIGQSAGMPPAVSEFEDEIDAVARSASWTRLSGEAVQLLDAEHFDYRSHESANLLLRAVADEDGHDDQAILRLITRGAPIDAMGRARSFDVRGPVIDEALLNQRIALIDPLLSRGALRTDGRSDQKKIDAAFRAAIVGGSLELVEKVWGIAADKLHPRLTYDSTSDDSKPKHKTAPVTLLLTHERGRNGHWDGLAIAKWLQAQGCDLKATDADGRTLLHIAAGAGDVDFVRYLLDHGLGASTPGQFGLPALGSAQDEDVALMLLQAGTDFSRMDDAGGQFRKYAQYNHWQRVISWLTAHGR